MGWWADGYVWPDSVGVHHHSTIRSLVKLGLLEGNALGEDLGRGALDGRSKKRAALWTSAKGRKLLEKITDETGLVFDRENYAVVDPRAEQADHFITGHVANEPEEMTDEESMFDDEDPMLDDDEESDTVIEPRAEQVDRAIVDRFANDREAALAYDRVVTLFFGDDAETNFPPEESKYVVLPEDIMRQINALKAVPAATLSRGSWLWPGLDAPAMRWVSISPDKPLFQICCQPRVDLLVGRGSSRCFRCQSPWRNAGKTPAIIQATISIGLPIMRPSSLSARPWFTAISTSPFEFSYQKAVPGS
jgi:hypothetical protein